MSDPAPSPTAGDPSPGLTFDRSQRLTHAREFQAAFAAKARKSSGPLTLFAGPSPTGRTRLGLSIGRRVGNAVRRNRLKRALREAFRIEQHDLPPGLDLVVSARPHPPLPLVRYRAMLRELAAKSAAELTKRQTKASRAARP